MYFALTVNHYLLNPQFETPARLYILGLVAGLFLCPANLRADQTVVDAGATCTFTVPGMAANYAWRMEGTLVSTNGLVGTNGPAFTYAPTRFEVGTHLLACYQTFSNGVTSNTLWQVRVRIPLPTPATSYYIATNGSDANPGTLGAPFLTLERARNEIRTNGLPADGVTVWLRGGTYFRTNTFVLTNSDSGSMSAPMVYRGYPGETAVISAGTPLAANTFGPLAASQTNRVPAGVNPTNILEMDLPSSGLTHCAPFPGMFGSWVTTNTLGITACGGIFELFYHGQRMWLARYPNNDPTNDNLNTPYMRMAGVAASGPGSTNYLNGSGVYTNSAGVPVSVAGAFHYYPSNDTEVARWTTAFTNGGVWVSGAWRVDWVINVVKVLGVDLTNRVIELASGVPNGLGDKYSRPEGNLNERFWVLNLLEDMDQPGEWAIDFNRNKLYFHAPAPLADGSVVISDFAAPMVQMALTTNVIFQSLIFEDGLAQGILIGTNCQNNLVVGCTFRNMNNYAVDLYGSTNGVMSCTLRDLAGGGVNMHGGNASATPRVPGCNFVVNNIITNSGVINRLYCPAIDIGGNGAINSSSGLIGAVTNVVGLRVAHNYISGTPHTGILHGRANDCLIEFNDMGNFGQVYGGIGGVYGASSPSLSMNNSFRYNFFHDCPMEDGISFDLGHRQSHIYGNVVCLRGPNSCYNTGSYVGVTPADYQYLDQYNNLGISSGVGFWVWTPKGSFIQENAVVLCNTPYIWEELVISSNSMTLINSSAPILQSGPNMTYTNDPGFINLTNSDFRLIPSSPLYADMPNFEQIPFEMMGLYSDEIWSNAPGYSPYPTTAPATALGPGSATLNGALVYPQFEVNATVYAYWGTNDGGTNPIAWQNVISFGVQGSGNLSTNLTGLSHIPYYYRYFATNAYGVAWSPTSASFTPYTFGHAPASITWKGSGVTNVWDGNTNNLAWLDAGFPAAFWDGDTVTFDDSGSNSPAINLPAVLQPITVTVSAAKNYTFSGSGKISGSASLQKSGSGTLTVLTTNDYSGNTTISGGTLQVGNGTVSGSLGSGDIINNGVVVVNQAGDMTWEGIVSGPGSLTKSGAGTLTLNAGNSYSGATMINGGAIAIISDANLGQAGMPLYFNGGGLQINSSGSFALNNRTINLNTNGGTLGYAGTLMVTNPVIGPGSLTWNGPGQLIFTANNSYASNTVINGGSLQVGNGGTNGTLPGPLLMAGTTVRFNRTDATNAPYQVGGSIDGGVVNVVSGAVRLNQAAGSHILGSGTGSAGTSLILAGDSASTTTVTNSLGSTGMLVKFDGGTWILNVSAGHYYGSYELDSGTVQVSGSSNARFDTSDSQTLTIHGGQWLGTSSGGLRFGCTYWAYGVTTPHDFTANQDGGEVLVSGGDLVMGTASNGKTVTYNLSGGTCSVMGFNFNLGSGTNSSLTAMNLSGGKLRVKGTISGSQGTGAQQVFNLTGGILAVTTVNATNLSGAAAPAVQGTLYNLAGTLAPGDMGVPGKTTILGNYACSNAATLAMDIGGTSQAGSFTNLGSYYDFVSVSGNAAVAGSLNVRLLNNYVPATNHSFTILTASSGGLSGGFTNVVNNRVPVANYAGGSFLVVTTATSVVLTNFQVLLAGFTASATNGTAPLTVTFTNTSIGSITNRSWDFGDGFTTNTAATSLAHTFTTAATNLVTLTISGNAGSSTASLPVVVTGASQPPLLGAIKLVDGNLVINGTNGTAGGNYLVLATTNMLLPLANWSVIATNQFGPGGGFIFTNPLAPGAGQGFYRIMLR